MLPEECQNWICPDLRSHWRLIQDPTTHHYWLHSIQCPTRWLFSPEEGNALRYFTGTLTVQHVQNRCQQAFAQIPDRFVADLIETLIARNILTTADHDDQPRSELQLKASVQWFRQPDGFWILRNSEDVTRQLQLSDRHKRAIAQLPHLTLAQLVQQGDLSPEELRSLMQQLAIAGMLDGIEPPKPPKQKLTPLKLLFFSIPLGNPDRWLSRVIHYFQWIWTPYFLMSLSLFLLLSWVYGWRQRYEFFQTVIEFWNQRSLGLTIAFAGLALLVVSLHELGHALTLKHYHRTVPQVGLMVMLLFPAAYVNTTDQYTLTRFQRSLVVGAGVLCQVTIAAIAFWLWQLSPPETWLHTTAVLLMMASLFTIAINLNPLAKFDGYYLAVALTGINNLRSRSFQLYTHLLRFKPVREKARDRWLLAAYAPFSLAYSLSVFGFLLMQLTGWTLTNIPAIALVLFLAWAIYFYCPTPSSR